jgi:hypothetical protein
MLSVDVRRFHAMICCLFLDHKETWVQKNLIIRELAESREGGSRGEVDGVDGDAGDAGAERGSLL